MKKDFFFLYRISNYTGNKKKDYRELRQIIYKKFEIKENLKEVLKMDENNNSKSNNYKLYIAVGIAIIILVVGFYLYYFYPQLIPGMASRALNGNVSILAIGLDDMESVTKGEINADTLVLFKLDTDGKQLELVNLVTDKREFNPEMGEEDIKAFLDEISKIASTDIGYYITVSYQGFVDLVDNLGGIDIALEEGLKIPDLNLDLKPGVNTLVGQESLNYSRWYDYTKDENDRVQRQQQILNGIIEKTYKGANLLDLPQIFKTTVDTYKSVKTNVDYTLIADIVEYLRKNEDLEVNYSVISQNENTSNSE